METIIEVNKGLLSDNHLVMTNKGWIKAKNLKFNIKILDINGNFVKIEKIYKCKKRPKALIINK